MLQLEISTEAFSKFDSIKALFDKIEQPLLDEAGAFVLNRVRTRFLGERDPEDHPWEPSKAALKRRRGGGTGTLFDTGKLFRSIQSAVLNNDQRIVGTDVEYGKYLNYGFTHWKSGKLIGPWAFMGITQQDAGVLEALLGQKLNDIISRAT